jgi:DEAD/DEAH box helicase domain-containing protein
VLLTTPTASGKSLVFAIPPLEAGIRKEPGRGLWLFPLKALSRDQLRKLEELRRDSGLSSEEFPCGIYDGDTSRRERKELRAHPPRVLLTNPDMLHVGLLPYHTDWEGFFSELQWLVVDELHVYRGLFGSHVHHVFARLERLLSSKGRGVQIIAASATAGEADRFATRLFRREFSWIEESGAPQPYRWFWFVQPLESPYKTTLRLMIACLEAGLKTICFTRARRSTELLWAGLKRQAPALASRVRSYRAGFLPEERREIERALQTGLLEGVIATSALELGLDIGELDVCLLCGWPGSKMAAWQRSGRVGRSGRAGLTVLIAFPDALDQYLMLHPEEVLATPKERFALDPKNPWVAAAHLQAAAWERPLDREDDKNYLNSHVETVRKLVLDGELLLDDAAKKLYPRLQRPHRAFSLRGGSAALEIRERSTNRLIGTIDSVRARREAHPGAIYFHAGSGYRVSTLDLERKRVWVSAVETDCYTEALMRKETRILKVWSEFHRGPFCLGLGQVRVTEEVVGYEVRRLFRTAVEERVELQLPPVSYETQGVWILLEEKHLSGLVATDARMGGLHAAEHASIGVLPLVAVCERSELGGISFLNHEQLGSPGWIVYDGAEGGSGVLLEAFHRFPEWAEKLWILLEHCSCEDGCPACIFSPKCGNGNRPLNKEAARAMAAALHQASQMEPWEGISSERPSGLVLEEVFHLRLKAPSMGEAALPEVPGRSKNGPFFLPRSGNQVKKTVVFDLETLRSAEEVGGWHQAHRFGVALGVALELESGVFHVFPEERVEELADLLRSAERIVGFNVLRFDYRVLEGYLGEGFSQGFETLDVHEEIWRRLGLRVGLNRLVKATLGLEKSADGLQSLSWVREGRFDLVEAYCRRDVELLRDLYLHGRELGFLKVPNREGVVLRVPVAW